MSLALDAVDTMYQVASGDMSLGDGLLNSQGLQRQPWELTGLADGWGLMVRSRSSFVGSTLARSRQRRSIRRPILPSRALILSMVDGQGRL